LTEGIAPHFTPIPDPTVLTTEQLTRESLHLRELFATRLDAMDKAVAILQAIADRSPTVNEVYLQHEEKFRGVERQFAERDTRMQESGLQAKLAVDAALQAAKEAVAKSEAATMKAIDQLATLMASNSKASDDKIDDLKGRQSALDGRERGLDKGREPLTAIWMMVVAAVIAAAVAFAAGKFSA